jgi:hypothetical protein
MHDDRVNVARVNVARVNVARVCVARAPPPACFSETLSRREQEAGEPRHKTQEIPSEPDSCQAPKPLRFPSTHSFASLNKICSMSTLPCPT